MFLSIYLSESRNAQVMECTWFLPLNSFSTLNTIYFTCYNTTYIFQLQHNQNVSNTDDQWATR